MIEDRPSRSTESSGTRRYLECSLDGTTFQSRYLAREVDRCEAVNLINFYNTDCTIKVGLADK